MNNSADDSGGGMYNRGQSLPTLIETTVCENSPDQIAGSYNDNGGNCVGADCDQCDCPADLDGDGDVDASDLTQLLADWGCRGADCAGDVNNDGRGRRRGPHGHPQRVGRLLQPVANPRATTTAMLQ